MSLPTLGAGGPSAAAVGMGFLLRATFDADNQEFSDGQVLDTAAEGVLDGSLTIKETDGTLAIVSNKLAFTAQTTPDWNVLGYYSNAITRGIGIALIIKGNYDDAASHSLTTFDDTEGPSTAYNEAGVYFVNNTDLQPRRTGGGGGPVVGTYAAATDYIIITLLGGYDVNGVPYRVGETKSNYLYGSKLLIRGGIYTTVTLLYIDKSGNQDPLYVAFNNYDADGNSDDVLLPDPATSGGDLSEIHQPTFLNLCTADNGTALTAVTPEVGSAMVHQAGTFEIQSNKIEPNSNANNDCATFDAGIADIYYEADIVPINEGSGRLNTPRLMARFSDTSNYWYLWPNMINNRLRIVEVNGGTPTTRAETAATINTATEYHLTLIADGQTITAFIDGASRASYGSAALNESATLHGIMLYKQGNPTAKGTWDNLTVWGRTNANYDTLLDAVLAAA